MQTSSIMGKTATIAGATGLIGSHLLNLLLKDETYSTVRILIRRPISFTHPKLEKKLVDFSDADSLLIALTDSDVVFCAIGTTQKKVNGNKEEYRKIDHDIPVRLARLCKEVGCERFVVVSAAGANRSSRNFYLKLKGEVEESLKSVGLGALHIMRPSVLLGEREEVRKGERLGQGVMKFFRPLIPSRYKPIEAVQVARAMVVAGSKAEKGVEIWEYDRLTGILAIG